MSDITYTPENHSKLEEWIDSCPRELANVIFVTTAQKRYDGRIASLGIFSILDSKRGDVIQILDEAIDELQKRRYDLLEEDLESAAARLQRMLNRSKPPM
jgi:hypothetical protein